MKTPERFYTYAYLRENRTPYYIGKGEGNRIYYKRKGEVRPPKDKSKIIFLKQNLLEEEAFKHEKYMIAVFGRKDLGTGILRNKTNGGEGICGYKHSKETRKKIGEIGRGRKCKEETRNKMSDANSGEKSYWYGKSHTQSSKEKMRDAKLGDKNVNCKIWKLTFDDGRETIIRGLSVWAEQNGYRHQGIRLFYQGFRNRYKDIVKVEKL